MRGLVQLHLTLHSATDGILHRLTLCNCCRLVLSLEFCRKITRSSRTLYYQYGRPAWLSRYSDLLLAGRLGV